MKTTTDKIISRLFKAAPVKWEKMADKLDPSTQHTVGHAIEGDIERQTFLATYLSARSYGQDHAKAVKVARKKVVAVRRALGYTYPDQGAFATLSI